MAEFYHQPIMLREVIDGLRIEPTGTYVDCTTGGAGHSKAILARLTSGRLICIDKDPEALAVAKERLDDPRVTFIHDDFKRVLPTLKGIDGVLMDLGVSSYQIDTAERGFSYRLEGTLDMRMNPSMGISAEEVVNSFDERQLSDIIYKYGEDRFANRIAHCIVEARREEPIRTTLQLAKIVEAATPTKYRYAFGNPAKRTFQALRIYVNDELNGLYECILTGIENLNRSGRIAVITFHSLEDRIVKNAYRYAECDCICDKRLPVCTCQKVSTAKIITKHPLVASDEELEKNPRAESAKLRIAERK